MQTYVKRKENKKVEGMRSLNLQLQKKTFFLLFKQDTRKLELLPLCRNKYTYLIKKQASAMFRTSVLKVEREGGA
jgi:hypothetical protein